MTRSRTAALCGGTCLTAVILAVTVAGGVARATDPSDEEQAKYIKKGPLPPVRLGEQVKLSFPPPAGAHAPKAPVVAARPLAVTLHQPEGVEQIPPAISVSFNQPMVPVTSTGALAGISPVRIEPAIAGSWKWLGTNTISLVPKQRIAYATRYHVTVPVGTKSANGQALGKGLSYSFDTPLPAITQTQPYDQSTEVELSPPIVLTFNQAVSAEKIASRIRLADKAGHTVQLRAVPRADWAKEPRLSGFVGGSNASFVAIFLPVGKLTPDTSYTLTAQAGLSSDEGALPMAKARTTTFSTYPKLSVKNVICGGCNSYERESAKTCEVGKNLCVSFNHQLKADKPASNYVSVTPRPADLKIRTDYAGVHLDGSFRAGTKYTVSVEPGIRDTYDQGLGRAWSGDVAYVHMPLELQPLVEPLALIEKEGALALPIRVVNVDTVGVKAYRVPDDKLAAASNAIRYGLGDSSFQTVERQLPRIAAWEEPLRLPKDHEDVHALSLKSLVAQHGPGPTLLVIDHAPHALLVQLTDLGLTARYDSARLVVLATSIATGKPLSGVKVRVLDPPGVSSQSAITGSDGTAVLQAARRDAEHSQSELYLIATLGRDRAFLLASSYGDDQRGISLNWGRPERGGYQRGFFYADRDLYRPGETIEVYGIERRYAGDVEDRISVPSDRSPVTWTARSSRNRELGRGTTERSPFGSVHFSVKIPDEVDLGQVSIETPMGSLSVQVQEYRAPEFEVGVKIAPRALFFSDRLSATVTGRYLFGSPMRGASVRWDLFGETTRFSAPQHEDFHFGSALPRWREERWYYRRGGPDRLVSGAGKLDANGSFELATPLADVGERLDPTSLIVEAQVTDVSRQVVAGRASVLAHPTDRYVGVRVGQAVIEVGKPAQIELVLVDLEGKRVSGVNLTVHATSQATAHQSLDDDEGGTPAMTQQKTIDTGACVIASATSVVRCSLRFPQSGSFLLEARGTDSKQRAVITRCYVDVAGKDRIAKDTKAGRLEVRFDRKEYRPGQTAMVSLRTPFESGVALLTSERRGLLSHQVVKITGYLGTAKLPVREDQVPNVEVSATAIEARGKDHRPAAWATGNASLAVTIDGKALTVTIRPQQELARPGERVGVDVLVTDALKRPVSARVSLVGVDEAVLSMSGFLTPDPLAFFHNVRESGVALAELLKLLLPEEPKAHEAKLREKEKRRMQKSSAEDMAGESAAPALAAGPGAGGSRAASGPQATRRLFLTTPLAAVVNTDGNGKAHFTLPLPDNLTRFRLMAVAVDGADHFGHGQSAVTVQRPLQLRASLPRFINTSDAFLATVIVDNQTQQAGEAEVTLAVQGVELVDPPSAKLSLGAGEAKELSFQVRAPRPGAAKFRFAVKLGKETDAVERTLPIWTPATTEAFATYGSTTGSVSQPVAMPKDALPGYGGLSITLAATALTGLQDAAKYLIEYPYGCAEQVSSRAMPILVLGDIVAQFGLGGPEVAALQKKHAAIAIDKLISGQRSDGSWGTWGSPDDEGRADLSAYILIVLRRGKEAGLTIPDEVVQRASSYLTQWISSHEKPEDQELPWRRRWVNDIAATALYAISEWGVRNDALANKVYANRATLDTYALAFLTAVFHRSSPVAPERAALLRELGNRAIQTAAALRFQEQQSEALQLLMHSSSRTDAIALLVLLEVDPKSELIEKAVRGLMDARINGRWDTTQANAYALYALSRYFKIYEAEPTAFTASMWLGQGYLGASKFEARSMREEQLEVPMKVVAKAGASAVTLAKEGSGRLYYRVGLRYAPREVKLEAADEGITVSRSYEAVERPDEVVHEKDGAWSVRAGSYVRVRLQVVVQDRRHYVVVDDPLPAGLELVNTEYKTSAHNALDEERDGERFDYSSWRFNHRELRDERSLHFADELEPGAYTLTVIARATARGTYIVPPTRSEEMYHPEVFGRSATDRMTVR